MKKNLRIASAAAAALLAVAPVAASAVNPANAAVTVDGKDNGNSNTNTNDKADGTVTVNISLSAHAGTKVDDAEKSIKVTVDGATFDQSKLKPGSITIVNADDGTPASGTLQTGQKYAVEITGFSVTGLTTGKTYALKGGKLKAKPANSKGYDASDLKTGGDFTSDNFKVYDNSKTGDVSFVNSGNSLVNSGSVKFSALSDTSNEYKVSDLVDEIIGSVSPAKAAAYTPVVDNGSASVSWDRDTVTKEVEQALTDGGVKVTKGDTDTFTKPAGNVVIPLTATASNGNKATLRVTLLVKANTATTSDSLNLAMNTGATVDGKTIDGKQSPYTLKLSQNSTATASTIASQFNATYTGKNGENAFTYSTPVTVKSSNLNTAVVGNYQVVLTATNPLTNKSMDATVNVTVGNPGKTATVEAGSDTANVVNINGNNVSSTSTNLANGAKVATFGTVDVNGTSYTRINGENSNEYVLTKYVDGSIKPSQSKTTSLDVMYKSAIYNKDGKTTGKHIKGYTSTEFEADKDGNPVEVTINGGKFLKLAGDKGYVRTRNVRGSKMTLKKNAYVYKSNGKRANKKLLKKGTTITVFGGQYRAIRHYRKNAVRIGHNQYVKVVNVKYRLAD